MSLNGSTAMDRMHFRSAEGVVFKDGVLAKAA